MMKRKTIIFMALALVLALSAFTFFFSGAETAAAREGVVDCTADITTNCRASENSTPVSDGGIVPELWLGNPNCSAMGYSFGFKLDGAPTGTFQFTDVDGVSELTGGALEDLTNSVMVSSDGLYLTWESTLGIDAVFVKGGPIGGNLYNYDPEDTADSGLSTPAAANGISHIEFCYDYELDVTKDAHTSLTRTYEWDITKTPDADYVGFAGDSWEHEYTITVDRTGHTDGAWAVEGAITIVNNTPFGATIEDVADEISGDPAIAASVDCGDGVTFPYLLPVGETLICSYDKNLPDGADRVNTATVETSGTVNGNTGEADVLFNGATTITEVNATVNVTDDFGTPGDSGDDKTFGPLADGDSVNYSRNFSCSTDANDYPNGTYSDPALVNTAEIDETDDSDDATVTVTCYAPVVSKTAIPAWEQFYDWDIFKNVNETTFSGSPGDGWMFNYDIDVNLTTYDEVNFSADGIITVQNPDPDNVMTVGLTDAVGSFNGIITPDADCSYTAGSLTIPAGGTAICEYSVDMGDDQDANKDTEYTNTATATLGGGSFIGTATFKFNDASPTLAAGSEPAEVTATDDNATPGDTGDDHHSATITQTTQDVIKYSQGGSCPTDVTEYINGVYTVTLTNIADIDQTTDTDTEIVNVTCYAPVVSKTAIPAWEQFYDWDIFKNVNETTFSGSPSDGWTFNYDIDVTLTTYDELNFSASGIITVQNPDPDNAMTVEVSDAVTGVGPAIVDCDPVADGNQTSLTVAAASSGQCSYSINMGDGLDGGQAVVYTNVATAVLNSVSFTGDKTFTFGDADPTLATGSEPAEVTVTDDNATADNPDDDHHSTTITETTEDVIKYSQGGSCPTDVTEYTDGVYTVTLTNIADIDQTTDTDTETVTVTCYAPVVSKTAIPAWEQFYDWDIFKNVDNTTFSGGPGDGWTFNYDIDVDLTTYDELNFSVSGIITVQNPDPDNVMTVGLTDAVDSYSGIITPDADCNYAAGSLTIPAGSTATCEYSMDMGDDQDANKDTEYTNTATATLGGGSFIGTATFKFNDESPTLAVDSEPAEVTATDDNATPGDTSDDHHSAIITQTTQDVIKYSQGGSCPTDAASYINGEYTITLTNVADIDQTTDTDTEIVTITCKASYLEIHKTTNGGSSETYDWQFALFSGPNYGTGSGFLGGTPLATDSTLADANGILDFGDYPLNPNQTYTVCELEVSAGWSSNWSINGVPVATYDPHQFDNDPETLGYFCVDIGAGTDYALTANGTLMFAVDNAQDGEGGQRTPGYWKNWSSCTGGNQYEHATTGDPDGEFWALDELLIEEYGITIGSLMLDGGEEDCEDAVNILSNRDIETGKNKAKDAAYRLARQLLAAQLNYAAGAGQCQEATDAIADAEALLVSIGFDGTGNYLRPRDDEYEDAVDLAYTLDQYNNGLLCTP